MHIETQFSIFLINKPGVLSQTLGTLAKEKVNIVAMTMMDSVEHGVLRLVSAKAALTRTILQRLSVPVNETEVICVNLSNQPGALADITAELAQAHININYAYCTAGARGGRTTGILKVADVKKALKVLQQVHKVGARKRPSTKKAVRPSPSRRGH